MSWPKKGELLKPARLFAASILYVSLFDRDRHRSNQKNVACPLSTESFCRRGWRFRTYTRMRRLHLNVWFIHSCLETFGLYRQNHTRHRQSLPTTHLRVRRQVFCRQVSCKPPLCAAAFENDLSVWKSNWPKQSVQHNYISKRQHAICRGSL